jgi:hypothetical protein
MLSMLSMQFSVLLLLIFALELGAGISGYMMRSKVSAMLEKCMNAALVDYNNRDDFRTSWDIMQHDVSANYLSNILQVNSPKRFYVYLRYKEST